MGKLQRRQGLSPAALRKEIKSGKRALFYLLHGDEDFERDNTCAWLTEELAPSSARDFNLDLFHGDNFVFEDFLKVYLAYPMMAAHRLVVLKGCEKLSAGDCKQLESIIEAPAETTLLIAVGGKVDLRRKFFGQMAKKGHALEFRVPFENRLPQWIQDFVRDQGMRIEPEAVDLLRLYIGPHLRELAGALDKLASFTEESKKITRRAVEQVVGVTRGAGIFELTDAIGYQNTQKSMHLLHSLMAHGEDSGRTIAMIGRHFRLLLRAQDLLKGRFSREQMAAHLGVAPFFLQGYLDQARRNSPQRLWEGLAALLEAEVRLRSRSRRQESTVMDLLVHRLCAGQGQNRVDRN